MRGLSKHLFIILKLLRRGVREYTNLSPPGKKYRLAPSPHRCHSQFSFDSRRLACYSRALQSRLPQKSVEMPRQMLGQFLPYHSPIVRCVWLVKHLLVHCFRLLKASLNNFPPPVQRNWILKVLGLMWENWNSHRCNCWLLPRNPCWLVRHPLRHALRPSMS